MISGKIELGDVESGFRSLDRATTARKNAAFAEIKPLAKKDLRAKRKIKAGPSGAPWDPGDPESLRKARRNRRRNRRAGNLGKLPTAWKSQQEPEQLRFVNAIEYAGLHHAGGTAGQGAKIPARPFGYFSDEFAEQALQIWAETVLKAW